ncbi:ABC transporter permease [Streptomyces sp. NPDC052107]|uniref:ABC transporter permease n=1 Tax=Streptomyces sp. NPDC052107 TaxID=3155632 RepID=UPI003427BD84
MAAEFSAEPGDRPLHPDDCAPDPVRLSLTGVTLGQAVAAVLAVLVIGNEYGTGLIHTTLAAVPGRATVLAAKAAVVAGATLVAGLPAVLASALAARGALPTAAFPLTATTLRACAGSVLYLVLVALLALGLATAVRDAAVATGTVLGLLYLFPLLTHVVTDAGLRRLLTRIGPMPAGLAVRATTDLRQLPIGPWTGLGVLALWTTAALLAGGAVLRLRDA